MARFRSLRWRLTFLYLGLLGGWPPGRAAALRQPKAYCMASAAAGSTSLVVLNVVRNGTKAIALAQLSIPTDDIDRPLSLDRQVAVIGSLSVLLLALLLSPLIVGRALRP